MANPLIPDGALPCLWMSAGVLTYRLCDRAYECEGCPLDAALQGTYSPPPAHSDLATRISFPDDRRYSAGHLWLRPGSDTRHRCGLDAFAVSLLPPPTGFRWPELPRPLAPGEALCEIALAGGSLTLGAPVHARLVAGNQELLGRPRLALSEPYGHGWIAELEVPDEADGTTDSLFTAQRATQRAVLDLRLFRRRIAWHLLADSKEVGLTQADGGSRLTDLRQMVGRETLLGLLRELIY